MSTKSKLFSKMNRKYLFDGMDFLFVPNLNSSKVSYARKNLARNGGAHVQPKFDATTVTHVLVDTNLYKTRARIMAGLKRVKVPVDFEPSKILSQAWLVDSIEQQKVLATSDYAIDLNESTPKDPKPHSTPTTPKSYTDSKAKEELKNILIAESSTGNPNERTMALLNEMAEQRLIQGEQFRAKAYKGAIQALNNTSDYISTANEALRLKGIGVSMANKIEEIVKTNKLSSLDEIKGDKEHQIIQLFTDIHGVGNVFAKKWYEEGARTLEDVSKRTDLTNAQKLGLKYYDDWKVKIPRNESTVHYEFMTNVLREIDPKGQLTIGGSYRRGISQNGDIDFMVTKPGAKLPELQEILTGLIKKIDENGYLTCSLQKRSSTKFLAGCTLPPEYSKKLGYPEDQRIKCRRVDFLLVPWSERGAAFLYFTGNDYFNRIIRLKAVKNGLILNECGLFKRIRYVQGKNVLERRQLIESFSEKKILKLLGFKYVPPEGRNFGHDKPIPHIGHEWKIDKNLLAEVEKEEIIDDDVIELD